MLRYEEEMSPARWLRVAGVVVLTLTLIVAVAAVVSGAGGAPTSGTAVGGLIGVVAGAVVGVVLLLIKMRVEVSAEVFTMRLIPLLRRSVPLRAIAEATVTTVVASRYGGIGYRLLGHDRVFLLSSGPAVVISLRDSTMRFICRTDHPQELSAQLRR